jgi:hypothetical protein
VHEEYRIKCKQGNSNNRDRDRRLVKQQEMITMVVTWLKEEGMEPEERTDLHGDARYFAAVRTKKAKKRPNRRDKRGRSLSHPFSKK